MKTLLSKEDLHDGVTRMADKIAACYENRQLTIVGVLTGSVVLMADLIRVLDLPMRTANEAERRAAEIVSPWKGRVRVDTTR